MAKQQSQYTAEEIARRGDEIYEQQVRAQAEPGNQGKIVAIDVQTGSYALGDTAVEASNRLQQQQPEAVVWFVRIGHRGLHRFSPVNLCVRVFA